jgi:hypothetical protein
VERTLPEDLVHFIRECIDRLETLDLLLLLHGTRGKAWTVRQLSDEMRSSPMAAETALGTLVVHGLVAKQGEMYVFSPRTATLEEKTVRLAACYRERRTAVIEVIFSRPSDAVRGFAEAFRIRKGRSDG